MPIMSLRKYINYIQSQENVACCTASAVLLAAEIILMYSGNRINFSRLFLYYMTRKMKNRIGDKGAELSDTLETLMNCGATPEKFWPFRVNRVDEIPDQQAIESATYYKLRSYNSVSPDDYKYYLNRDIPVIVGIMTGKIFWQLHGPLENHRYKPVNIDDNQRSTGHAIVIVGYDDNLNGGSWIIANSTGPKWGYYGYAAIPYSCSVDIGESFVITNFAGISAGKKIIEN